MICYDLQSNLESIDVNFVSFYKKLLLLYNFFLPAKKWIKNCFLSSALTA